MNNLPDQSHYNGKELEGHVFSYSYEMGCSFTLECKFETRSSLFIEFELRDGDQFLDRNAQWVTRMEPGTSIQIDIFELFDEFETELVTPENLVITRLSSQKWSSNLRQALRFRDFFLTDSRQLTFTHAMVRNFFWAIGLTLLFVVAINIFGRL